MDQINQQSTRSTSFVCFCVCFLCAYVCIGALGGWHFPVSFVQIFCIKIVMYIFVQNTVLSKTETSHLVHTGGLAYRAI